MPERKLPAEVEARSRLEDFWRPTHPNRRNHPVGSPGRRTKQEIPLTELIHNACDLAREALNWRHFFGRLLRESDERFEAPEPDLERMSGLEAQLYYDSRANDDASTPVRSHDVRVNDLLMWLHERLAEGQEAIDRQTE
jgi:hypothetical protein